MTLEISRKTRIHLIAGLCFAGLLTACDPATQSARAQSSSCDADVTPIARIQGDAFVSPSAGSEATVRGIVTRLDSGTGFYLEEPGSDRSVGTSNGIYIVDPSLARTVTTGQKLLLTGHVSELGDARDTLTALTQISNHTLCDDGLDLPETALTLPLDSLQREAVEGMRVSFSEPIYVTDVYNFYRGGVTLGVAASLRTPTEDLPPGESAANRVESNREGTLRAALNQAGHPLLLHGSQAPSVTGVMGHNGRTQQLLIEHELNSVTPALTGLGEPGDGLIRVVSMNLLNFFNGDGAGGGFPAERGAKNYDDFLVQAKRIQSALTEIQPALLAVQELENDGFDEFSAARALIDLLNEAAPGTWSVVETQNERIGNDIITVGLFYRSDLLEALGPPHMLDSLPFRGLSRQPLAQLFREPVSGARFLIAANHLKSKGSCPEKGINSDQNDGQGCWNPARKEAAGAVIEWVENLAQNAGTGHVLILGDMNAYRREDPIRTFVNSGYTDLVEHVSGLPQYSYLIWGQAGTLDYIFSSETLLPSVRRAELWHVNARWPQKVELPRPWLRFSDHDPVVVDLDFSQLETSD